MFMAKTITSTTAPGVRASRRSMLSGAALSVAASAVGVTASVSAGAADLVPANPDADLISACARFDKLERHRQAVGNAARTMEEDDAADLISAEICERQEPLLAKICSTPALTLEGISAIAASLVLWDGKLFVERDEPDACTNDRLKLALLRSVLTGRA